MSMERFEWWMRSIGRKWRVTSGEKRLVYNTDSTDAENIVRIREKGRRGARMKRGRKRSLQYPHGSLVDVKAVSRQRRWQIARRAEGKCEWCGLPLNRYAAMCDDCASKIRMRARKRGGFKPWRPGGRARNRDSRGGGRVQNVHQAAAA